MTDRPHLILASASPRRHDLLSRIGLLFLVVPADIDESMLNGELPEDHVRRLAVSKARAVSKLYPGSWVLGADTIVVIDGRILGKPTDRREAEEMLATLSSRVHEVFTGYAILNSEFPSREISGVVRSEVLIRSLTPEEISGYIDTGEPMDKAGAYAIQGVGSAIVERVSGSYTNVVGLPLCEVARDIKRLGIFDFLGSDELP
ncbi:MAG: Maf family protein [Desulfomonile sp.]|nr:Maf family protein [Desulfomonile sp.]